MHHVSMHCDFKSPQRTNPMRNERFFCFLSIEVTYTLVRLRMCNQLPTSTEPAGSARPYMMNNHIREMHAKFVKHTSFPLLHISHLLFFILKIEFIQCPGAEILAIRIDHDYFIFSRNEIPPDRIVFVAERSFHSFRKYSSSRVQRWHHWLHGLYRDSELRCIFRKSA